MWPPIAPRALRACLPPQMANEPHDRGRLRWVRLELALFLARNTGRRRGSIAGLQWEDVTTLVRCYQQRDERTLRRDGQRATWASPPERGTRHRILIPQSSSTKLRVRGEKLTPKLTPIDISQSAKGTCRRWPSAGEQLPMSRRRLPAFAMWIPSVTSSSSTESRADPSAPAAWSRAWVYVMAARRA